MKALEYQVRLDLRTGNTEKVFVQVGITVKAYFNSLNILNQSAYVYGVVYLASPEALELLGD